MMRDDEVVDGLLMLLLMDRRGNYERMESLKSQIGYERCAIMQLNLMPALANVRRRPLGNFSRLPFGGSIDNEDVHGIPPTTPPTSYG